MPNNFLITGSPGCGKTTVIEKVISNVEEKDFEAGGIFCPEIREGGTRKGFKIVDIYSGDSNNLAHANRSKGPKVGKYRVNVKNIDFMSEKALAKAVEELDLIVIDEIAPMETNSEKFKQQVNRCLDSKKPLLGTIHKRSRSGYIGRTKKRNDVRIFEVNEETRDVLPSKLTDLILEKLD